MQVSKKALLGLLSAGAIALVLAVPATASGPTIQNGSFQTCDLTAWSSFTQPGASVGATSGGVDIGCQGYVSTGSAAAGAESWLHHAFYATAGTKVYAWAHFGSDCNGNNSGGGDYAYLAVDGSSQGVTCDYPSGYNYEAHVFTTSYTGWHDFYAAAANEPDSLFSSTLFVDRLTLNFSKVS